MDPAKIREALGLAAGSSDDEVRAALASAGILAPPTQPEQEEPEPEKAPELVNAAAAPGTVVLASSVWEETQRTIKNLTSFMDKTKRDERDAVIAKAVQDGKFTPAQKSHFAALWDSNPDATRTLIGNLTKNSALAVMASGYDGTDDESLDKEFAHLFDPNSYVKGA
jgi:phage I-like protein